MTTLRHALICFWLLVIGCEESKNPTLVNQSGDPSTSKSVYRCEWSPLIDPDAKDFTEALEHQNWRVAADGICKDPEVYGKLAKTIASLPDYTDQDFPFVGYCEHYLLTDGSSKGLLVGFVCENYGIVVWETEADEQGRWYKTDSDTRRGTEADKAALRGILSKVKFDPL
jgi:hypothetical protein